uniref:Uncharacterized protein n=1 Tax=Wuchereria bancrofti TaxID=6293 RepID=A0A1I8EHG1_WUCBA
MICKEQEPYRLASLGRSYKSLDIMPVNQDELSPGTSRYFFCFFTRCMLRCVAVALRVVELSVRLGWLCHSLGFTKRLKE